MKLNPKAQFCGRRQFKLGQFPINPCCYQQSLLSKRKMFRPIGIVHSFKSGLATRIHLVWKPFRIPEVLVPEPLEVNRPHDVDPKSRPKAETEESPQNYLDYSFPRLGGGRQSYQNYEMTLFRLVHLLNLVPEQHGTKFKTTEEAEDVGHNRNA